MRASRPRCANNRDTFDRVTRRVCPLNALVLLGAITGVAWPSRAEACQFAPYPATFTPMSPDSTDAIPPAPPILEDVSIERSDYAPPGTGDCGDVGHISLSFALSDDTFDPTQIGVRLRLKSGIVPAGLVLPTDPVVHTQGSVGLSFQDDPAKPYAFTLEVTAIDGAGNESEPTDVDVRTGRPSDAGACSFAAHRATGTGASFTAIMALLGFTRARRRR